MLKLSQKRPRFILASAITLAFLAYCFLLPAGFRLQAALIGFTGSFLVTVLALGFARKNKSFLISLIIPFFLSLALFFVSYFFQSLSLLFNALFCVIATIIYYFTLLSLNVFLVSEEKEIEIPLLRPASTFAFLIVQFTLFLIVALIYKIPILLLVATPITFFVCYFMGRAYFWSQGELGLGRGLAIVVALFCSQLFYALAFFPLEDLFRSLVVNAGFYTLVSSLYSLEKNTFRTKQVLEYLTIFAGILLFISLV
ncbi:hypothetical protein L6255_00955 [Candidatus Parcubacteria bacterium]|nr:hypothetical protein [Patescibacteria group bacterium]MBU4381273.1 hypothetical protein [Patescibacteria group bacterium]MCG2688990.1 hypothetical protein [Candidatus Parcubacteria bacterium]